MIDRHFEDVVASTPAMLGIHDLDKLHAQSSPGMSRPHLHPSQLDNVLLDALLVRWRRRYSADVPAWSDIALFRSLNMAYQASLMPAGADVTFYDVGRLIALWVSALEILIHPGGNGKADREKVLGLIEKTAWERPGSAAVTHSTGNPTKPVQRTLASWLCARLYECRNDFLHGNPVGRDQLLIPGSERRIFDYAAPLYRIALTSFLPLRLDQPAPPLSEARAFGAHIAANMSYSDPQRTIEDALLTAVVPPPDPTPARRGET
jgi:hypothetical protein